VDQGDVVGHAQRGNRNAARDTQGERRSNATHLSTTDPAARRIRKGLSGIAAPVQAVLCRAPGARCSAFPVPIRDPSPSNSRADAVPSPVQLVGALIPGSGWRRGGMARSPRTEDASRPPLADVSPV